MKESFLFTSKQLIASWIEISDLQMCFSAVYKQFHYNFVHIDIDYLYLSNSLLCFRQLLYYLKVDFLLRVFNKIILPILRTVFEVESASDVKINMEQLIGFPCHEVMREQTSSFDSFPVHWIQRRRAK